MHFSLPFFLLPFLRLIFFLSAEELAIHEAAISALLDGSDLDSETGDDGLRFAALLDAFVPAFGPGSAEGEEHEQDGAEGDAGADGGEGGEGGEDGGHADANDAFRDALAECLSKGWLRENWNAFFDELCKLCTKFHFTIRRDGNWVGREAETRRLQCSRSGSMSCSLRALIAHAHAPGCLASSILHP